MVRLDCHLDFVTDTNKKEASFSTVDSDLTDEFIEALGEELFSEGANTGLTRLTSLNASIELVLQIDNVNLGGGLGRHVTHPEAALIRVLSRGQNRVEVVLVTLLLILASLVHLVDGCLLLSLRLLVRDACGHQHGVVVADERLGRLLRHTF